MRILFVTFDEISMCGAGARSAATILALADAGHQIDVIAARIDCCENPNVRVLEGGASAPVVSHRLRSALRRAARKGKYDAAHAVDQAALSVASCLGLRKIPLLYDAARCFSGSVGIPPSSAWKLFPVYHRRKERKLLSRARFVLSPCPALDADLKRIWGQANMQRLEHAPVPGTRVEPGAERSEFVREIGPGCDVVIACCISFENADDPRAPLMAARKVLEAIPSAAFVFMGPPKEKMERLAANLDIHKRCQFLDRTESERFVSMLSFADAVLFVPARRGRYIRPELVTFLASPAPLVVAWDGGADDPLNEENHVPSLNDVDSIAEALLRVVREPLFSIGIATQGQSLVAERFSLSSFKHKLRMIYHEVFSGE